MQIAPAYNICKGMLNLILSDLEIKNYCQEAFGRPLTGYLGLDLKDPPTEAMQPWICAMPTVSGRTQDWNAEEYQIAFGLEISSSGKRAIAANFIEISGYEILEDLALMIFKKILDDPAFQSMNLGNPQPQFEVDYPFLRAVWSITLVGQIEN